jgi:hypothetical protein
MEFSMQIDFAHLRERARAGGWVNFAVFQARSSSGTREDNARLLAQLTAKAQASNLRVDQAALAFMAGGRMQYFGTPTLVDYLAKRGVQTWTHTLSI